MKHPNIFTRSRKTTEAGHVGLPREVLHELRNTISACSMFADYAHSVFGLNDAELEIIHSGLEKLMAVVEDEEELNG